MERLTRRGKKNRDWHVENRTCPYLEALDRLCEYEDTGLSPEEVWKLKANKRGE